MVARSCAHKGFTACRVRRGTKLVRAAGGPVHVPGPVTIRGRPCKVHRVHLTVQGVHRAGQDKLDDAAIAPA